MKDLFDNEELLLDIWKAYYGARKNKRNTMNAMAFELDLEHNIYRLYREITEYRYEISPSICFIVNKPVKREIFAAHFRDRVVHHYLIDKLLPVFENQFIYDCYSCRKGKGTLFGIDRLEHFMRSATENYTKEAYVLKLDIKGFFMSIDKRLLLEKVRMLVERKYEGTDKPIIQYLLELVIMNDPTGQCKVKGRRSDWQGLPQSKSLFYAAKDCGLPIGNITSQIFANYYLTDFDRFVKETLKMKCYGRYVDDFFIVHRDKQLLKSMIPVLRDYLHTTVGVTLHPKKIYLQPCGRGVSYLGVLIKPYGRFLTNRIWGNVNERIEQMNRRQGEELLWEEYKKTEASINSYIGLHHHTDVYRRMLKLRWRKMEDVVGALCGFVRSPFFNE